jgi:hypothetical protein
MIEAIRMAHSDQPLTDEEVAPFLFAEELADRRADLAASILSGRFEMESYCAETNHCLPLSNSEVVTRQTHSVRLSEDAS